MTMGPVVNMVNGSPIGLPHSAGSAVHMSQSPEDDGGEDTKMNTPTDGPQGASSNSDGASRKRRRSRKGLDKRFECQAEGCGKSYSRAEHL